MKAEGPKCPAFGKICYVVHNWKRKKKYVQEGQLLYV